MDNRLLIGWALNAIWLQHLIFKNKSGRLSKSIAILLLIIPYLGFIFYFIFFVWDVPPPQPPFMRQNMPNHYGKTAYGASDAYRSAVTLKEVQGVQRIVQKKLWIRVGVILIGLTIILFGFVSTLGVGGSYLNWWGGPVFGPAAIIVGSLFLYLTTKRPRKER